jgi:hypothetical protein
MKIVMDKEFMDLLFFFLSKEVEQGGINDEIIGVDEII